MRGLTKWCGWGMRVKSLSVSGWLPTDWTSCQSVCKLEATAIGRLEAPSSRADTINSLLVNSGGDELLSVSLVLFRLRFALLGLQRCKVQQWDPTVSLSVLIRTHLIRHLKRAQGHLGNLCRNENTHTHTLEPGRWEEFLWECWISLCNQTIMMITV